MATNFRNKSASQHSFAMVPRSDIPRSTYMMPKNDKLSFDAAYLVPIYCEEMVPGDHFKGHATIFARAATPTTPVLDNAEIETFYFFVPNRIIWENWEDFIAGGNYTVPYIQSPGAGYPVGSIYDYFGIPTVGQVDPGSFIRHSALPLRAYSIFCRRGIHRRYAC